MATKANIETNFYCCIGRSYSFNSTIYFNSILTFTENSILKKKRKVKKKCGVTLMKTDGNFYEPRHENTCHLQM